MDKYIIDQQLYRDKNGKLVVGSKKQAKLVEALEKPLRQGVLNQSILDLVFVDISKMVITTQDDPITKPQEDKLRKGIGKKDANVLNSLREKFNERTNLDIL